MKKFIFLLLPALLLSQDLKSLLELAQQNNNLLKSSQISVSSKEKELDSAQNNYYPTLDANAFYKRDDDPTPFFPGTTYGAAAKLSFDIYDGGKKSYTKKQKNEEVSAAKFSHEANTKSMFLNITKAFYNLKSLYSSLDAREEASKAVKAQLQRMQAFYDAKLATSDDVDRLQSAYDRNIYAMESLKFQILSLKKSLELQVGTPITRLENSTFKKLLTQESSELDSILALRSNKKALKNLSETIDSYYYPNITLEDTYTLYGYQDKPTFGGQVIEQLDKQNTIMATLNLRVLDFGVLREQKEAIKLQADALHEQIIYKSKEQKMQLELSRKRIQTAELNIKSSRSALKAATSALKTITKKYNAGIVDNVVYLDALSSHTEAKALYEKSLNDLEIAYAIHYYYHSKNLKEYLQ
ncbi:MAG: TolC family protein [Epsilonproteobacteria bacterium]|nr:TolC family protein [Campylobacterota bacterium]